MMEYTPSFITNDESAAAKKLVEKHGGHWDMHTVEYYHEPSRWENFKGLFKNE